MRVLTVIGIGMGDPRHLTGEAVAAIAESRVIFLIEKEAAPALALVREHLLDCFAPPEVRLVRVADPPRERDGVDYLTSVAQWHARRGARLAAAISRELSDDECGAILAWGDPALYDSTLRILNEILALTPDAFELRVVAGLSSVQALAAALRRPLHGVGESLTITTGRRLRDLAQLSGPTVVMLDGDLNFSALDATDVDIAWGAFLGSENQVIVEGLLADVIDEIRRTRRALRDAHGWVFDTYLLTPHR